jgi:serine/threonine protein kinase
VSDQSHGLDVTAREFASGQKVFGRYTLKRILGRGGMGIVWLARDEELEREVALKFLPELVLLDKTLITDLKRETRRSLELTHKNIVRIYDFVQSENTACISMEYIDGETLSNLRAEKEQNVFQPDELAAWTAQLCDALDYAHNDARIIHRDLKPANLMVNQRAVLKVSDFGIARSLGDSMSRLTMARGASGTLVYMSPQQLDGERGSHLDDIYSLGATLYELLTSKPPFYSGNIDRQVHERTPPSMTERRKEFNIEPAGVPALWEETVAACLAKDPTQRPQSTREIARRLQISGPQISTAATSNNPTAENHSLGGQASSERPAALPPPATGVAATRVFAGVCLACTVLALVLHFSAFRKIDRSWEDWLRQVGRKTPTHPEFVFLGISTKTLSGLDAGPVAEENRALQLMTERPFPWSREVWALALDRLFASGARLVIFSIVFAQPNDGDSAFRAALDKYHDRVAIGANFDPAHGGEVVVPNARLIPSPQLEDDRVGLVTFSPDEDEKVRRAPYVMPLPVETAVLAGNAAMPFRPRSLIARALEKLGRAGDIPPDLEPQLIRFSAIDAYSPIPLWEIFTPNVWLSKYSGGEFFEGKVVIVGVSAGVAHDFVTTPVKSAMPGPVLHLHALAAALNHEFLHKPGRKSEVAFVLSAGLLGWTLLVCVRRRFAFVLALVASVAAYLLSAYLLYNIWGILLPLSAVVGALLISGLVGLALEQVWKLLRARGAA